jgi:bacterioferritin
MECRARNHCDKAANEYQKAGDLRSLDLFTRLLLEEEHIDFVEEQFDPMNLMGDQLYAARQVSSMGEDVVPKP